VRVSFTDANGAIKDVLPMPTPADARRDGTTCEDHLFGPEPTWARSSGRRSTAWATSMSRPPRSMAPAALRATVWLVTTRVPSLVPSNAFQAFKKHLAPSVLKGFAERRVRGEVRAQLPSFEVWRDNGSDQATA